MSDPTNPTRGVVMRTADLERLHAEAVRDGSPIALPEPRDGGPGTELAKLLARAPFRWLGFKEVEGCGCRELAAWMDRLGADGCERELSQILAKLGVNHEKLRAAKAAAGDASFTAPFTLAGAELVVRRAIRRARRRAAGDANKS